MLLEQTDVIYSYTRKQAIEDGDQMLLSDDDAATARESGFRYPVYLTGSVVNLMIRAVENKRCHNDWNGVLWDVLFMASLAVRRAGDNDTAYFKVVITGAGRTRNHQMLIKVGAVDIDDPAPCFTIMFPEDD